MAERCRPHSAKRYAALLPSLSSFVFLILNCGFKTLLHIYVLILRKAKMVTLEIITDFLMQFVSLHGDLMSLALPTCLQNCVMA